MSSKNNLKKIYLFLFVTSLLFFSFAIYGCTNGPTDINIYTGTQGVTAQLIQNNPPLQVYEDSVVILMAEVWNRGAHTPGSKQNKLIYVTINVDDVYFKLNDGANTNTLISFYLSGKSPVWPIGEKTIVPVGKLNVNKIQGTRESPSTQIEVSACYPYKTYFSESICVDTDIYNLETKPICRNKKTYSYAGQGAPVIVSRLDVDMVPVGISGKNEDMSMPVLDENGQLQGLVEGSIEGRDIIIEPNFRIYFRNADQGVILAYDENENPCLEGASPDGIVVKVSASLGTTPLECEDAEIQMYSSEGSVRCSVPANSLNGQFGLNRNYELPLRVEAEYFYKTTSVKDVKIVRVS